MSEINFKSTVAPGDVIALVGPPNSGKTTLFNWLTNSKFKTVNYPGATVEYSLATLAPQWRSNNQSEITIMDTPGTYSLIPKSEDERVTRKALFEHPDFGTVKTVIAVVDGTQLARHLVLAKQLIDAGFRVVIALTMSDIVKSSGMQLDIQKLSARLGCPVVAIYGLLGGGLRELVVTVQSLNHKFSGVIQGPQASSLDSEDALHRIKESELLAKSVLQNTNKDRPAAHLEVTRIWDRWLLHPVWGLIFFIGVMSLLFTSIFVLASPFMDAIDGFFSWGAGAASDFGEGALWSDFLGNGVLASFGAVLVFVPQIFILFLLIGALESTGYLARAATLIDRPLSLFGMSGRSFVPILSGFACAVPALMATRNISSKRDRLITMMIIPLLTCSARLPVYTLLLAFLFRGSPSWYAGLSLTGLYLGGIVVSALVSQVLNQILKKDNGSFFMMELPIYRRPRMGVVVSQAWSKTFGYIKRAGPPIFIFAMLIWAGTTFPHYQEPSEQVRLETSFAGQLGQIIEPVFKPMGADWRVGVSLISAFAAREVFAGSLAVIFNIAAEDDDGLQAGLLQSMETAKLSDGRPLFTTASVCAILVFVMIALQCTSTTAMMIRESGSFKWAVIQLCLFNLMAYLMAVGVYQIWS